MMMATVEVVFMPRHGLVHAPWQGGKGQGVQQESLNEARGRLASFGREKVGLHNKFCIGFDFGLLLPTVCSTKWPNETF